MNIFSKTLYFQRVLNMESVSYTHLDVYKRQHPYRYKMAAINSFCYRAQKCLKETESKDRELKTIKGIVRNNNYRDVYKRQVLRDSNAYCDLFKDFKLF